MSSQAKLVRRVALVVGVAWAVILYLTGIDVDAGTARYLTYIPTGAVFLAIAFDLWLWRLPPIHHFCGRPRIDGTWVTTLVPHPESHIPAGGNRGPITAATVIEQTFWTVTLAVMTVESRSRSTAASILDDGDSKLHKSLYYLYVNNPRMEHQDRSPIHSGASRTTMTGMTPTRMEGTYWTDRFTKGSLELELLDRRTDRDSLAEIRKDFETGDSSAAQGWSKRALTKAGLGKR